MNEQQKVIHYSMSCTQSEILRLMRKEAMDDYLSGNYKAIFKVELIDELNKRMAELSSKAARELTEKVKKRNGLNP